MMQGTVNQNCEATLPIVLKNGTATQLVDTVIDTGFSGFLTLPSDIISALGFKSTVSSLVEVFLREREIHFYFADGRPVRRHSKLHPSPAPEEKEFWQELKTYEEERKMPYITSVERIGRKIGRKEGKAEERQSLVSLQLRQKVGPLPKAITDRITQLSPDQQQNLAIALLNFNTIADLEAWLTNP
ncbi:MAG: DUF4351 domain-containing protein [Alkalinema sp. RU_4_3]|nr:DUF4351 domain-containing protein [Alkalinema sp. RU_4_3]